MGPEEGRKRTLLLTSKSLTNLLEVVYVHTKSDSGGDLYLTRHGLYRASLLEVENWYETSWFGAHAERLSGTSAVHRVPTKEINGERLQLVVKNCRVGEDVPLDTHTLIEFINAEFNSPWEEFSLVMEMRENEFGPGHIRINAQLPLAIYVPPERLQLWQTGRSRDRISKIMQRHPGVELDILRQYKMIYQWIEGLNIVEALREIGHDGAELKDHLIAVTSKAIQDLEMKGFVVADMKPSHIIIGEDHIDEMRSLRDHGDTTVRDRQTFFLRDLVDQGRYSVVDYELLMRSAAHEVQVRSSRRHSYLDDQRDRFQPSSLPLHLSRTEIMDVPYVHGSVESTGGHLWVVGRNPHLFDYFLPERWRKTPCRTLSPRREIYYTLTKDNVHLVWKTSRVGEKPQADDPGNRTTLVEVCGFNSPFEEFGIAMDLTRKGVPTVYCRAVYMTGTRKVEPVVDLRRFDSHKNLIGSDNLPILREDRNYITIRGFFNGPDAWVASREGLPLWQPWDLVAASNAGIVSHEDGQVLLDVTRARLHDVGYDGTLLELNDVLVAVDPEGQVVRGDDSLPDVRICNLELIRRL